MLFSVLFDPAFGCYGILQ